MKIWNLTLAAALAASAVLAAPAAAPKVTATDGASLRKAVAAQKGKVVLVNLWATWCGPCVAEFPDMVKLHNAYKAKGLEVLAVSVDEPEDRSKVVAFIKKQKAGFPVYTRAKEGPEKFVGALDRNWSGAVPVTYVYDRSGKLVGKPHVGLMTYKEFEAAVTPHL